MLMVELKRTRNASAQAFVFARIRIFFLTYILYTHYSLQRSIVQTVAHLMNSW
jgi:hypothetical protein